jgi:5'-3' exonuclease
MGIPYFFQYAIAKSPESKQFQVVADNIPKTCARLFLDFNSIIHPCSAKTVANVSAEVSNDELHRLIFDSITEYTCKLVEIANPRELLYIAVDGVAPRAKMHQQRKRRFLSAQRNVQISEFKKHHKIPMTHWDSNCITPGTVFMCELNAYLESKFIQVIKKRFPTLQNIIVSGSTIPGEGEHKMMHYIKQQQTIIHRETCDVIYGLDADLIMLSLTCSHADIVLMRESQEFGRSNSKSKTIVPFKYLVISNLRESIKDMMGTHNPSVVHDYIFICYFLGNDFLPSLPFLKIKEGALDILIECYRGLSQPIVTYHDTSYHLNMDVLTSFIEALTSREDEMMIQVTEQYQTATPRPPKNFNTILTYIQHHNPNMSQKQVQERGVHEYSLDLEEYPLRHKAQFEINPKDDRKWRNAYYYYMFGAISHDMVRTACMSYLQGLKWMFNYYFNFTHSVDCQWYYAYDFAPCVTDLHKNALTLQTAMQAANNDYTPKCSIDPAHLQLLLVLPPQSKQLLPLHLQPIMTDLDLGCVQYYPLRFEVRTYIKHKMWECCPAIPNINIQNIHNAYETITIQASPKAKLV